MFGSSIRTPNRLYSWLAPVILLVIIVITAGIYSSALHGPFLFDDHQKLQLSRLDHFSIEALIHKAHTSGHETLERPISYLSFSATHAFLGSEPVFFKSGNLAIHITIGALFYILVTRILGLLTPERPRCQRHALAAVAASLWLLEPMHVSTVLYVVQRMAQLSALFVSLALLAYLGLRHQIASGNRQRIALYATALITCSFLGLASKQDAALIPVYILTIEIAAHSTPNAALHRRNLVLLIVITSILPILAGLAGAITFHESLLALYDRQPFSLAERLATEPRVLWLYAKQLIFPRLSEFGLYANYATTTGFADVTTYLALAGWILTLSLAFLARRIAPVAFLGVLWFVAAHSLESTFVGLALSFEHRNYFAALGITLLIAELLTRWRYPNARTLVVFALLGIISLFSFQTWARVQTWSDKLTLARNAVIEHPTAARARASYARLLLNKGNYAEGVEQLRAGRRHASHDSGFDVALLLAACRYHKYTEGLYESALAALRNKQITPYTISGLRLLRQAGGTDRCQGVNDKDVLNLLNAAVDSVRNRTDKQTVGVLHTLRGTLLAKELADHRGALESFRKAAQMAPRSGAHWLQRIRLNLKIGNTGKARALLHEMRDRFPLLPPLRPETIADLEEKIKAKDEGKSREM